MANHDLIVIGAGPGGYVASIRAAQLGMKVACIEREPQLGGTCLRVGCIPSKALLESSALYWEAREHLASHGIPIGNVSLDLDALLQRKDKIVSTLAQGIEGLFKKHKIQRYRGAATLRGRSTVEVATESDRLVLEGRFVLLATGSKPSSLPGIELHSDRICTSTEALAFRGVPHHLVVIGAGYIGLELGSVWRRLGAKVTVLEYLDRIFPGMDADLALEAKKIFEGQGLEFRLGCKVTSARLDGSGCVVEAEGIEPIKCDRVLVAVGRVPCTDDLGLAAAGIELDKKGRIPVDGHYATRAAGVYAIGDVIGGAMLAHKAEEEGMACAEGLAGGHAEVDYNSIPAVAYTEPEMASVGKTEEQLQQEQVEFKRGMFPFMANGRARALGKIQGRIKILADARTDRVLGVHILGARAGDLIAEAAVAIAFGASSEDIARCSHAHPTLAEAMKEAALSVAGRAIHI